MTTARDLMTPDPVICHDDAMAAEAARQMAREGIGAVPVCDADGHLTGVITDRDLTVRVLAAGRDPQATPLADLLEGGEVVTIGADDSAEEALRSMKDHAVRRLPVIDGSSVVGMVSEADIARALPDAPIGDLVSTIADAPAQS